MPCDVCVIICGAGEFGVGNPDLGDPAMDEGRDGEGEAARGMCENIFNQTGVLVLWVSTYIVA